MPLFTIETTYRLPFYRQHTYDAATVKEACRLAIDDEDWNSAISDHECAGETYVTGIWSGADRAYEGKEHHVPSQFDDTLQRKADHFGELAELLDTAARPAGLSKADFEAWLPWAQAAVDKAKAIVEGRPDPDEHHDEREEQDR